MIIDFKWLAIEIVILIIAIVWYPDTNNDPPYPFDTTSTTKYLQDSKDLEETDDDEPSSPATSTTNIFSTGVLGEYASTHKGWIQLGQRSYKIYCEYLSYDSAMQRCINHHPDGQLAVVTSFKHSQILGRYLLASSPRLKNAWIGARWNGDSYQFEPKQITLPNASDRTWYPPWRQKKIEKSRSCILLDRHVSSVTVFVEASCKRLRPYICYVDNSTGFTDLIRGDHAYRLHYNKKNWINARNHCKDFYANYSAHLAEIREPTQLYDLLRLMTKNETAVKRIWLGGKFNNQVLSPTWIWDSDKKEISTEPGTPVKWINNSFYESPSESRDDCLAMDNLQMNYGMACKLEQSYVCQFPIKALEKLQKKEKKKRKTQHHKRVSKYGKERRKYEQPLYAAPVGESSAETAAEGLRSLQKEEKTGKK